MLEVNNQDRGSGKTTKVIELMKQDTQAVCLVPYLRMIRLYPKSLQDRVISSSVFNIEDIITELRYRKWNKLYINELALPKFDIAKLFYRLGKNHISVIVYGTE